MASFRLTPYGWRAEVFRKGIRDSESAFPTKAAAVAWAGQRESEIMAGTRGEIPNLIVKALLERYSNTVSEKKKGKRWELIRLKAIGRDRIAQVRLRSLDTPHAEDWQERRLQAVSEASVRRERNLLNNVFNTGIRWRWLKLNPFKSIPRPQDGRHRQRIATAAEQKKLIKGEDSLSRAVVIALEAGMRASEIASNPQIVGRIAKLVDSKNGDEREVPLSDRAVKAWSDPIDLTAGSISTLFARRSDDEKIAGLTFHDLRHTAATTLAKKLTLFELCRMFGWKDPRHALRYYNEAASEIAKKL